MSSEGWDGHKFKKLVGNVWICECGIVLYEKSYFSFSSTIKRFLCSLKGHYKTIKHNRCKRCGDMIK